MTARILVAILVMTNATSEAWSQALPTIAEALNGHTEVVTYRGLRAVKLVPAAETEARTRT